MIGLSACEVGEESVDSELSGGEEIVGGSSSFETNGGETESGEDDVSENVEGSEGGQEIDASSGDPGDVSDGEEGTSEEGGEGGEEIVQVINGIPAPESVCPYPEPWGYKVGDNLKNMAFQNCEGDYVSIYDIGCGASVSWIYFTYGW